MTNFTWIKVRQLIIKFLYFKLFYYFFWTYTKLYKMNIFYIYCKTKHVFCFWLRVSPKSDGKNHPEKRKFIFMHAVKICFNYIFFLFSLSREIMAFLSIKAPMCFYQSGSVIWYNNFSKHCFFLFTGCSWRLSLGMALSNYFKPITILAAILGLVSGEKNKKIICAFSV